LLLFVELVLTACGDGILRRHVPLITPAMLYLLSVICLQVLSKAYSLAMIIFDTYLSCRVKRKLFKEDWKSWFSRRDILLLETTCISSLDMLL
jgi:hypothetical protein